MLKIINGALCDIDLGPYTTQSLSDLLGSMTIYPRSQKLHELARRFLHTPFAFETRLPPVPDDCVRVRLSSFDCITLIYHLIALAWASTFEEYVQRLIEVRYQTNLGRAVSNDPEFGTIFDYPCEALLENAASKGLLTDVTSLVAGDIPPLRLRLNLRRAKRPKAHDDLETYVVPRMGERPIRAEFIPSQRLMDIPARSIRSGDIILFTVGAVSPDGSPLSLLIRHAAIADCEGDQVNFIHATKDFFWRPRNETLGDPRCTGQFLNDDPKRELIGVGIAGMFAGDELTTAVGDVRYFGYDQARPRPLHNYAAENFAGVKVLRLVD